MTEANAQNPEDKQFAIQKIYLKDVSFETPNSPEIFTKDWQPEINLNLSSDSNSIAEDVYEVVLSVTVTAKLGDQTAYLCEVQQSGIFTMAGFSEAELHPMLGAFCPNTLYPFAREAICDLVMKGGFPQLVLAPINFDALYAQKVQEMQAQVTDPGQPASH
ncbi:protein-export chaperone SecB [Thiohalobacter sp. IOR34]|uniref:protein-export chaperone SecB n=1 Tax=Thiohalobacter sp. IOR34 TaxID=3057176 RepID=UPI0025AFA052|nr:protein-export chaperone SecB [Thiohalobacter sp. IOR34]WJW75544.1 protein-export chaperone SecB [Thiohalobacter sp. IOR34]